MPLINESGEPLLKSFNKGLEELKFKQAQGADDFQSHQQTNFNQNNAQEANAFNQPKGLISLPPAVMQLIPWIPFALEAISGQKIPPIGGTIGEIQSSLAQIQFSLTQLLSNQQRMLSSQQQLYTKLESLENNASSQLNNLSQQLTSTNNNFRLIAQETKRSLEFQAQPKELESN